MEELYKNAIINMIGLITDESVLKRIYTLAKHLYIKK